MPSFGRPVIPAIVTSIWGDPRPYRDGVHQGLDFRASLGTPVYAVADGRVTVSKRSSGPEGEYIKIDHGAGFESLSMHLSERLVQTGAVVTKGQKIGLSGATGIKQSAPHLHLTLKHNGRPVPAEPHIPIDRLKSKELERLVAARGLSTVKYASFGIGTILLMLGTVWALLRPKKRQP